MIRIIYDRAKMTVTVRGHARFAEAGSDVVCAGVSALTDAMFSRAQDCDEWQPAFGFNRKRGSFRIRLSPKSRNARSRAREMLETVGEGYEMIAQQFPQFVSYEVR